ncbi:ArsR family transcriptional regulator [Haloferax mediterranei ATCC 33500]|uniref:Transcriptional regulator n=1 Tax=Haloferax mediterranei (strain ATCC 33500 / DSM 1411 / JCM 8866 / NBRC 14739 / NCIMB 2177 / R-4) TaxID=523841 RepID=I3R3H7_HALMT|nr:winged helix-turn-helix domain-containing protein [Haloferax mediterranei]AFK18787.2 putative transcriptional regulator, ArsR family [Haloferax mediterranei ATCC 33500]AHZ21845.1 transcriptional regulator [Haloferax mediterranei ATCC 33500]EMA03354.1 ArsR family transcriptional regulator [Haloferax mediterranei ATCC 33500]MDX5988882.1 winged helix-turn-helix domain-containing protein [Haloferax mediterranei ATCC 33500]QCQ75280.1 ArsR family transcriptional regulator [Haloferax mediterranei 
MDGSVASDELLNVLGDTESRALLVALCREPRSAKELGETLDRSLPTVYRRLDRLCECGLVASTTEVRNDGTHYRRYECTFDRTLVSLSEDGFLVEVGSEGETPESER